MNFSINNIYKQPIMFKSNSAPKNAKTLHSQPTSDTFEKNNKDNYSISIGYVNDLHGQTNNMLRILSGLKGDIVLSAGDNDIGDEKNSSVHKATIKFLNMAKVKGSAFGNHELDTTQQDAIDIINKTDANILSVNLRKVDNWKELSDNLPNYGRASLDKKLKKSTIIEVKGEKIGLVGASPIDMFDRTTHPNYHKDCFVEKFKETEADIQKEVDNLKKQGVNKIILLSHLGLKLDQILAQKTDGIDVIISGHTHELVKDITEGENLFYSKTGEPVVLTEAGKDGAYFGQLNVTFDKDGVLTKAQNNVAETRHFSKNLINQTVFDGILGKPEYIGVIKQAPPPPKSLIEENPHANFVCDVMKEKSGADIGLWHNCGVRNFFHEGVIDSSDIKAISPFLDKVVVANVTEKALVNMFKDAIKMTYDSEIHKPGLISVAGLDYTVNPEKGELVKMNFHDKQGNIIELDINNPRSDKTYKVVTDEFLMSAGADFDVLAEEKDYIHMYDYDKDVLTCQYIKEKNTPIVIDQVGRINFTK